jgi:hypothetical protein
MTAIVMVAFVAAVVKVAVRAALHTVVVRRGDAVL